MKNLRISSKGQALVLVALMLVVLLALAGIAVDVGMAYGVKAKLNSAVDVAALAAGRVISQGAGVASTQAKNFFNANYPSDLLGSTVTAPVTNAVQNADGSWTIEVTATASVPTNFAKLVGFPEFTVNASATSTRRTLDLVLVLDSSASLGPPYSPSNTLTLLQGAARQFIANFDTANDRVGLIHFASGVVSDMTITATKGFDLAAINSAIGSITVAGATVSEEAMRKAKTQLDAIPAGSQNSLRAIVFFSDGAPNCVAGDFMDGVTPVQGDLYSEDAGSTAKYMYSTNLATSPGRYCGSIATLPNMDYTGSVNLQSDLNPPTRSLITSGGTITNTRCNVNMAARNMLENVANAARSESVNPIHIFTIGLGNQLATQEVPACYSGSNELGANIMQRLANIQGVDTYNRNQPTGLYAYAADAAGLKNAFRQVANALLRLSN